MKYRVKSPLRLEGRWRKPGEIVKGAYDPWVGRGFLERLGEAASPTPSADVVVIMGRPVSEYVPVAEESDDLDGFEDDEELLT